MTSRRNFIRTSAIGGAALIGSAHFADALGLDLWRAPASELYASAWDLMQVWSAGLLKLQVLDKSRVDDYGGIWCPADKAVHGRVGDAFYPMLYMADRTKDSKYLDSAMFLYKWIDRRVSQPDGSWLNEPVKGAWKGTTVFATIAMAEGLKNHGSLLDNAFKSELTARLKQAGDYICTNFNLAYGNINYPVTGSYAMALLGEMLDEPKFKAKGKELAYAALKLFSVKDGFLTGEGGPIGVPSRKGCYSVDLGYNVEESLPSLVMYGLMNKDEEVLGAVTRSMQTHMEFMLPDGAWDNSWGTRDFKWTYWGSRTSDGCQAAYALMAHRDPRFYQVALKNLQLMQQCTVDGLLTGGPHNTLAKVTPCVHHTFTHIKALATMLDEGKDNLKLSGMKLELPREQAYGYRFFNDVQTGLIAKGNFRATVTGYDREYKQDKNGHATGGALTMLWHKLTGPILSGSMNEYQLFEAGNMMADKNPDLMPLTPRMELKHEGKTYMNISDLNAGMDVRNNGNEVVVITTSKLVDKDQLSPETGAISCVITYTFGNDKVTLKFSHDHVAQVLPVKTIVPVIARADEKAELLTQNVLNVRKEKALVSVMSNHPVSDVSTSKRMYNPVPGFEAIPLGIDQNNCVIEIRVTAV